MGKRGQDERANTATIGSHEKHPQTLKAENLRIQD